MISTPTPFDRLFADLTDRIGVLVTAESSPSMQPRIVFERAGAPEPQTIPYRVAGEHTIGRLAHPWIATVYGSDDSDVTARLHALLEALDDLAGPPQGSADLETLQPEGFAPMARGYQLKPGKLGGVVGGDGVSAQFATDVGVTLYTRVRKRLRGSAQASATLQVTPLDPSALATPTEISWPA